MNKILVNGALMNEFEYKIGIRDRAYRFGDGVFETIRVSNGYPIFYQNHYSRFILSIDYLGFNIGESYSAKFFFNELTGIIEANSINNGLLRVLGVRRGVGMYAPENSNAYDRILFTSALKDDETFYSSSKSTKKLGVFEDELKSMGRLSNIKTNNALIYVLAKQYMQKAGLDEVVILNQARRVAEATSSNIFCYKNGVVTTPALTEGCIDGVIRRVIRKLCKWNNVDYIEGKLTLDDLKKSEEIFTSNAGTGITPVESFLDKEYSTSFVNGLQLKLDERVAQIIEQR